MNIGCCLIKGRDAERTDRNLRYFEALLAVYMLIHAEEDGFSICCIVVFLAKNTSVLSRLCCEGLEQTLKAVLDSL